MCLQNYAHKCLFPKELCMQRNTDSYKQAQNKPLAEFVSTLPASLQLMALSVCWWGFDWGSSASKFSFSAPDGTPAMQDLTGVGPAAPPLRSPLPAPEQRRPLAPGVPESWQVTSAAPWFRNRQRDFVTTWRLCEGWFHVCSSWLSLP